MNPQTTTTFKLLPSNFNKACRTNKTYQEYRKEFPDWLTIDEIKMDWLEKKENYSDKELLEIFPEAKAYLEERSNYLTYKVLPELKRRLKQAIEGQLEHTNKGFSRWFYTKIISMDYEETASLLNKELERIKRFLFPPKENEKITPAMIERAKAVPMKRLFNTEKNFVLCPFHEELTPSFYIKENAQGNSFGYCFSCGKSCDSISYIMETQSMNFREAVETLNRY